MATSSEGDSATAGGLLVILGIILALAIGIFLWQNGGFGHRSGPNINVELPSGPTVNVTPKE